MFGLRSVVCGVFFFALRVHRFHGALPSMRRGPQRRRAFEGKIPKRNFIFWEVREERGEGEVLRKKV